jgi:hypothetical protein
MKCRFEASDFEKFGFRHELSGASGPTSRQVAEHCNAIIEKWESESVKVVCRKDRELYGKPGLWAADESPHFSGKTHEAYLWNMKEIKE